MQLLFFEDLRSQRIVQFRTTLKNGLTNRDFPPAASSGAIASGQTAEVMDLDRGAALRESTS